jgi:hypothetical protein
MRGKAIAPAHGGGIALAAVRQPRLGWAGPVLLLVLLSATAVARLTGQLAEVRPDAPPADPIGASQAWLAAHDYRLIGQFTGADVTNVTMVRRGGVLRGEVQIMDAQQIRQTGYYRFRVRAGLIETTTSPPGTSVWLAASPAQQDFLRDITDPRRMLAPFLSGELSDAGRSGETTELRNARGDSLYLAEGHPVQVVTHTTGGHTSGWRIASAP